LAIIKSDDEENILLRMLQEKDIDTAWLGVHDLYQEGDWITVLDEPLRNTGYTKWTTKWPNEPDNHNDAQNCARLISPEGGMDDESCDVLFPFLCKLSA
jgi:hypothetical protein